MPALTPLQLLLNSIEYHRPELGPLPTGLEAAIRAAAKPTPPPEGDDMAREALTSIKPHVYSPDYQAMGDCRVCGHDADKPWHQHSAPAVDAQR